ncbi:AMP-binding protein [Streptomyces sp. NPDC048425]|uniref:AMP-binding protein n=1 Tax=Streptomyces sp. NPDC048425 TaxID=3365548 RepID=UPI00371402E9
MSETSTVLTPAERRAALERDFAPWEPRTIDGLFDQAVEKHGSRPYVIAGDAIYTYADVQARAYRFADGLRALGVQRGDHVALLMANFPEYTPLKLAIARVGAVAVPLNYLYKTPELEYALEQSHSRFLITMTSYRDQDYLAMLDELAPEWGGLGHTGLGNLERVITFSPTGDERRDGVLDIESLERIGAECPGAAPGGERRPEDPSDIMYTSGTTGKPKGVLLTHDSTLRSAYGSAHCRALPDGNKVVFALPCYHMFGYEQAVLASMFVGGAILPQPKFEPLDYFRAIEKYGVTDVLAVPTMSVALVEHTERSRYDLTSLARMLSAAAVAPMWLWERIRSDLGVTELTTAYGMTELSGATTMTLPEDPLEVTASTVGRPKPAGAAGVTERGGAMAEIRVVHPLTGEEVAPGETGELISRGPTTMLGYWDRPEETAEVLRGEWMHSGDMGRFLEDGSLVITGRSKEVFKSGGELVMPKEIEDFLTSLDGVSQAHVVGLPDERWGEVCCAFVSPEPGATVVPEELVEACHANLARFKVPRRVFVVDPTEVPQTPSGKVQKFRLIPMAQDLIGTDAPTGIRTVNQHQGE